MKGKSVAQLELSSGSKKKTPGEDQPHPPKIAKVSAGPKSKSTDSGANGADAGRGGEDKAKTRIAKPSTIKKNLDD